MRHLLVIILFSVLVATVFATVGREAGGARMRYGLKVFLEFVGVGLALGWLLYLLPR